MSHDYPHSFKGLHDIVSKLRGPGGCPWDQEQTPDSLKSALVEEVFECIDAIEKKDSDHIKEELGDVMLLVSMIGRIYEEDDSFEMTDVFKEVNEKLIRRHPHVFGDVDITDPEDVVQQWDRIKSDVEGRDKNKSLLAGVPKNIPPLERSYHLQKKAAKKGFDWHNVSQVKDKLQEEITELEELLNASNPSEQALEEELGDVLFTVVNLCRFMKFDPTLALHKANKKFISRFNHIEENFIKEERTLAKQEVARMEELWNEAKKLENKS